MLLLFDLLFESNVIYRQLLQQPLPLVYTEIDLIKLWYFIVGHLFNLKQAASDFIWILLKWVEVVLLDILIR